MCSKIDPCCQSQYCRLQPHAQCSYKNTPDCCTKQCLVIVHFISPIDLIVFFTKDL